MIYIRITYFLSETKVAPFNGFENQEIARRFLRSNGFKMRGECPNIWEFKPENSMHVFNAEIITIDSFPSSYLKFFMAEAVTKEVRNFKTEVLSPV